MSRATFAYVPSSHLDLFWLGSYRTCLERGASLIKEYLDRCLANADETFLLETVVFAEYFLNRYPEYREPLRQLVDAGRVEIGTVFIDRWEHLILGESHIRNIQVGASWSEAYLGRTNPVSTHPDLPGLVAQTSQIYAQAGVEYYVTSRKVFEHGAVWRHRSPDGTMLTYLNWPKHYIYYPIEGEDLPNPFGWVRSGLNVEATESMFPLGTIPVNGGAGDLTNPADFRERYGASLQELIAANREKYPEYDFSYTVPGAVLALYADTRDLPEVSGEIPSVWGVACDETVEFFRRNREIEYRLLAAETMAVILDHLGIQSLPSHDEPWQGRFYESAFFASKDPIPVGQELAEIWKMHLFTEDHNGGGYEAALSTFQKRVMQQRTIDYTGQIIDHGLAEIGSRIDSTEPGILAFNPLGQPWRGALRLDIPRTAWDAGLRPIDAAGSPIPFQAIRDPKESGRIGVLAAIADIPSVGYRYISFSQTGEQTGRLAIQSEDTGDTCSLRSESVDLSVDRITGAIVGLRDQSRGTDWGRSDLGNIRAIREIGNDVTLRTDNASELIESTVRSVTLAASGALFSSIKIEREILGNTVDQVVSLWHDGHIELETRILWSGAHNWQLRLALPTSGSPDGISYGSPFYGSGWTAITADSGPRNNDELLAEDYHRYREVQEWLHVQHGDAGLLQITTHPGFCFIDRGLEAVLLRSSPSCGDTRFFWENAGEQIYRFAWFPTGSDWRTAGAIAQAQRYLRPPCTTWIEPDGGSDLPVEAELLRVEPANVVMSSLSRNVESGDIDILVFEAHGNPTTVNLAGPLVETAARLDSVDLRGRTIADAPRQWDIGAWRIQTYARRDAPGSSS